MQDPPNQPQGGQSSQPTMVVPPTSVSPAKATPSAPSQPSLSQPSLNPNMGVPAAQQVPPPPDMRTESPKITTDGKKKPWKLILVLLLVFSLLIGSLVVGAGVMVAYGKIPLENKELRDSIT